MRPRLVSTRRLTSCRLDKTGGEIYATIGSCVWYQHHQRAVCQRKSWLEFRRKKNHSVGKKCEDFIGGLRNEDKHWSRWKHKESDNGDPVKCLLEMEWLVYFQGIHLFWTAKAVYFKYAIGLMFPTPYSSRKLVRGSTHRGHTCQGSFKSDCHHQRKLTGNTNQPSVTTFEVYLCATFSNNNNESS